MKVAVTGASGYLGSLLLRRLVADPEVESILALDQVPPKESASKLTYKQADVRTADFATLLRGFDAVFHLAFIVTRTKGLSMADIDAINIDGSMRLFEGAVEAGVPRLIHASSVAAYGAHADNPTPLVETAPLRPNQDWYYSRAKGAVERFLDGLQARHPETVIVRLRPSIFLGPTVANLFSDILCRRVLVYVGPGIKIDFCWDEDVAAAFHLALRHPRSDAFNINGGAPLTIDEMGHILGKRVLHLAAWWVVPLLRWLAAVGLTARGEAEWAASPMRAPILTSARKARDLLGWRPQHDTAGTLVRFARSRGMAVASERPPAVKDVAARGGHPESPSRSQDARPVDVDAKHGFETGRGAPPRRQDP